LRIIRSTDAIDVAHPVFLIFGQPGICKTSLAYSAKNPLLLDFDEGAHRAANRKDTLQIKAWADVEELMNAKGELDGYDTIIPDTVGRCLDLMMLDIMEQNPKYARDGNLTQQGWGVLKTRFRTWMSRLRAMGKDVLLVAHQKEEKDGDVTVIRPDIVGGSYGEVVKTADFCGFLYMRGRDRVLDFSPTDRWIGKNPAGWKPFTVPAIPKATTFIAELFDQGRAALGTISEESAKIAASVDDWRSAIEGYTTPDEINRAIPEASKLPPITAPQVKKLLNDRAKALGFVWDVKAKAFTAEAIAQPA
jgi:hypothetical protein